MSVGSDLAPSAPSATIAGHRFEVKDRAGGLLRLHIALHGLTISELAMKLTALDGVRITKGPESLGRGRCFIAHCAGFKMVLSLEDAGDGVLALVSPMPSEVTPPLPSELSATLAELTKVRAAPAAPPAAPAPSASWSRRTTLAPGKPLARKTPLVRKTPLGRGKPWQKS